MDDTQSEPLDIRQCAHLLWRWLWLVALAAALAAGAAYAICQQSPPIYEGATTLLINEGQKATGPDYDAILMSERLAKTYAQMLTSRPVLEEAGARLGLAIGARDLIVEPVRDTQLVRLRARHPDPLQAADIANTVAQVFIEQNERTRTARVADSSAGLQREMAALQAEITATQKSLDGERAAPSPNAAEVARLEALLAQQRSTHSGLLSSYEEMRVAEARSADSLAVVEPAVMPREPVLPRTLTNTLLAGVVGAMLAAGMAFLVEYLDDTIKRPEDVERTAHLPVLACVMRFGRTAEGQTPLVAGNPRAGAVESYRMLRTNVQFSTLGLDRSAAMLLVTSARPGEGKTTTLANLAVSLAQSGKRVLAVDTDLRRPALHKRFGLANTAGLTSLLLDAAANPERIVQSTGVAGLRLLTAGPIPANPAELLDLPSTAAICDRLRALADYVLLDSPPMLSAADASILAQKVDGVLLVAETGRVRTEAFRQAVTALQRVQARLVGVVLNKVSSRPGSYYYYYYYDRPGGERQRRRKKKPPRAGARGLLRGAVARFFG